MQNFNFLKAFCLETATNCLPFFKKPANINYDAVDNSETTIWNSVEEKEKLKNDIWNDPNKSTIELNTMIPANTNEIPVNRAPKNSITADKSKLIGNINEDQIKKIEVFFFFNIWHFLKKLIKRILIVTSPIISKH